MFEGFVFELRRRRDSKHEASLLVSSSLLGQKVERLGFVGTSKACHHPSLRPERSREIDNLGRMPKRASRAIKSHLWASRIPPEPGITVPAISTAFAAGSIAARWHRTLHIRRQTCRGESALRTTKQKDGIRAREPGHIRVLEHSRTTGLGRRSARPQRRTWGCVRSDIARRPPDDGAVR